MFVMPVLRYVESSVCQQCLRTPTQLRPPMARHFASKLNRGENANRVDEPPAEKPESEKSGSRPSSELGAMSRRLQEATEEALLTGGAAGKRAVEDAGFSEELKDRLLEKITEAKFKQEYAGAFAEMNLTPSAGEASRHIATSPHWTGEESTPDVVLRMLDDSKKQLNPEIRGKYQPPVVDTRIRRSPMKSPGQKVDTARDRALLYSSMGLKEEKGLSKEERAELKKEFRSRFEPAARVLPATISGIAALANERIENAIARGQFKNLPRGTALERDSGVSNPFVDTTEYLMNRIIQRQEIVPPWIEKQQELGKALKSFRSQLRRDWKRHASRMIAAKGGSLEEQMARAEAYAKAERLHNHQRSPSALEGSASLTASSEKSIISDSSPASPLTDALELLPKPFRDRDWEKAEHGYMQLSVENINSIARSYNLMAPELAKKPYLSLQRELETCFADVAPLVSKEIRDRATRPKPTSPLSSKPSPFKGSGMLNLGGGEPVRIYESTRDKPYGFKEWWGDIWRK